MRVAKTKALISYQLRGYREADLRLCFRICKLLVFPRSGSFLTFSPKYRLWVLIRTPRRGRSYVYPQSVLKARGPGFDLYRRHRVVSLSKIH